MDTNSIGHLLEEILPGADSLLSIEKAPPILLVFFIAICFGKLLKIAPWVRNKTIPAFVVAMASVTYPAFKGWSAQAVGIGFAIGSVATWGHRSIWKAIKDKSSDDTTQFTCRKARVLLIDDEENFGELAKYSLPCCDLTFCTDLNCAFELLNEGFKPDAVIVDLRLPGTSGIDVVRAIKQRFPIPCLLISGAPLTRNDMEKMMREAGAVAFLVKPIHMTEAFWWEIRSQLRLKLN